LGDGGGEAGERAESEDSGDDGDDDELLLPGSEVVKLVADDDGEDD
jgi:hypothetical protein